MNRTEQNRTEQNRTEQNRTEQNRTEHYRIEWIDIARGFAMLSVILGHTLPSGGFFRGIIYSFHMPLFFILSFITFKPSKNNDEFVTKLERSFKHLILPAFFTYLITQFSYPLINYYSSYTSVDFLKRFLSGNIIALLFSSGGSVNILSNSIYGIDVPWFLVSLFCGKSLFDYLQLKLVGKRKLPIFCIILSILGVLFSKIQWLPFSFDIVLAIMPLFYIGTILHKFNLENKSFIKLFIFMILWGITFLIRCKYNENYFELATRHYPLYPLCLITALFGSLAMIELSIILVKCKKILTPITYLGKNSLYMMIVHTVERYWLKNTWLISEKLYINFLCRLTLNTAIFIIVMLIIKLYHIFKKRIKSFSTSY